MAREDIIILRQKELRRLHVIHKVLQGELRYSTAAELASLSERQIRRILRRIQQEGDEGIRHKSRGRQSNRKIPLKLKDRIIGLYREKYQGFGPTLTAEKLFEMDGIPVSKETIRTFLIESGDWQKGRKHRKHRQWRQRKEHRGEMVQMDGSHHDWFEGRGPWCVLMAYIDDATGRVYGRFYEYEGTIPAMDSSKRYMRKYGLPLRLYLDKHTTYKSTAKPTIEEELQGLAPMSQFERAMKELAVDVIHAHSPQAKGRIERLFGTLQDRLVKEMRLRSVSTIEEANRFLQEYLPIYNRKFSVKAVSKEDMHRPVPKGIDLEQILCIRTERTVKNDNTIAYERKLYQIEEPTLNRKVTVEERIDGKMLIVSQGKSLRYRQITERPEVAKQPVIRKKRSSYALPVDHPWRKFDINRFKRKAPQAAAV
ncbi:MAG: ISNCY family transposase [Thermodesulfovibrionales bacterium]|nr:ISNCY family transposase [Thermodesulfovibrionales bacterium]